MLEREVKLPFSGPEAARAAILAAGATPLRPRRLQDDTLFDTRDQSLRQQGCVLRVRRESGRSLMTLKGPVQPGTMKVRDEHETGVDDGDVLVRLFDTLGLHVWFRYQKYREEFAAENIVIAIDETPVGTFVEVEGGEGAIVSMTRALGYAEDSFVLDSYFGLFMKRRELFGLTGRDMVFATA